MNSELGFVVLGPKITREMQAAGLQVICPGSMKDLALVEAIFIAMARAGNLAKKEETIIAPPDATAPLPRA